MWDIFLSYSRQDLRRARALVSALRRRHLAVWFDLDVLPAGGNLHRAIGQGVRSSRIAVVLASSTYFSHNWPERELAALLDQDGTVISVLLGITQAVIQEKSPILSGSSFLTWHGGNRTCTEVFDSFAVRGFRAMHANHMAMIAGAGNGGIHILRSLLSWQSVPVAGIYDKRDEAKGLAFAKANDIHIFSGNEGEFGKMLLHCGENGCRGYDFFVFLASRDPEFRSFVSNSEEEARSKGISNFTILRMDDHFSDYAPPEALHALMRG